MSDGRESNGGLLGLFGVGMVVCCGLPVLLGNGVELGAAGLALGSGLVVAAGVTLGLWGWRRRQAARRCDLAEPVLGGTAPTSLDPREPEVRDPSPQVLSPTHGLSGVGGRPIRRSRIRSPPRSGKELSVRGASAPAKGSQAPSFRTIVTDHGDEAQALVQHHRRVVGLDAQAESWNRTRQRLLDECFLDECFLDECFLDECFLDECFKEGSANSLAPSVRDESD